MSADDPTPIATQKRGDIWGRLIFSLGIRSFNLFLILCIRFNFSPKTIVFKDTSELNIPRSVMVCQESSHDYRHITTVKWSSASTHHARLPVGASSRAGVNLSLLRETVTFAPTR